jgi:hypothetical protein
MHNSHRRQLTLATRGAHRGAHTQQQPPPAFFWGEEQQSALIRKLALMLQVETLSTITNNFQRYLFEGGDVFF